MGEIRTATLAEIYARQGHWEKACAIYRELLLQSPGDPEFTRRLDDLVRRMREGDGEDRRRQEVERLRVLLQRVQARRRAAG